MDKKVSKVVAWKILIVLSLIAVMIGLGVNYLPSSFPTISQSLYWGSSGKQVNELQWRLQQWGYYNGPIDGSYGNATAQAVRKFQSNNGLAADGVAGKGTLVALGLWTGDTGAGTRGVVSTATSRGLDRRGNVTLLARVIHGEAGSEPYLGKVAVGAVILNRTASPLFPNTLAGVIYQPLAFESVSNGIVNREPSAESLKAAQESMNGWDPTYGALFFWNPSKPVSKWIWSRSIIATIGAHVFAR
ncbi:MAG: spore cortex-lytic enzyme [Carboxydocellales bacterium]